MMTENLAALIRYRMDQAQEALEAASILLREDSFRASINRSYYAMFYMVLALLASRKEETSKHSGAIALFDRLFVSPGLFPSDLSRWLRRAFDLRTRCDYAAMTIISQEEAKSLLDQATRFVLQVGQECRRLLEST